MLAEASNDYLLPSRSPPMVDPSLSADAQQISRSYNVARLQANHSRDTLG